MREHVVVAGSGAIACGLAATVAAHHGDVLILARSQESADRAGAKASKLVDRLEGHGRVRTTLDAAELAGATLVVEAVAEDLTIKKRLLERLHEHADETALLATTTSSLSVNRLAEASGRPDRFVGLHVFNPVPRMELIELVFPDGAADTTRRRAHAFCRDLGKTCVEVPDTPGFVVNRLLFPYLFDAVRLMERTGLAPEAVDRCMTLGTGHPMGPLALLDFVGLDVAAAIGDEIDVEVPKRVRDLAADGKLGKKAGRGFYDY